MAHKHNRRRVRPRSRRNKFNTLSTVYETSFDSLHSFSIPSTPQSSPLSSRASFRFPRSARGILDKSWSDPLSFRDMCPSPSYYISLQHAAEDGDGTLRKFGGEPGDDPGLCDKMQEMFDGMDWIE